MDSIESIVRETRERVTRIESRVVQLGDHVGANLRSKQRITIIPRGNRSDPAVDVDSLDVSAARILTELRQAGAWAPQVEVWCAGRKILVLYPPRD